eukprot:TRINITY_DN1635_c2_g1_i1.p1 TRINITY_DN1635_c2_g1~~TRINITY_DN1635_c2_g1_i1.p1  ORF type:complete len:173 (-),score=38.16 TRINITY_DN1635_c2_g1_i1:81-599(-)
MKKLTNKIDVIIHNGGLVKEPPSDPLDLPIEIIEHVTHVTLTTPFAIIQSLLPMIVKSKNPSVILTSIDINNELEQEKQDKISGYYLPKFSYNAASMVTKFLSEELSSKNIRVNSIDTGRFFFYKIPEEISKDSDWTNAFLFLSRSDTHVTGQQLDIKNWVKRDPSIFNYLY